MLGLLQRVEIGQLVVTDCNGAVFACGQTPAKGNWPKTEVKVLKETFWVRVLLFADMVRAKRLAEKVTVRTLAMTIDLGKAEKKYVTI